MYLNLHKINFSPCSKAGVSERGEKGSHQFFGELINEFLEA
jgi:hypothetical protein